MTSYNWNELSINPSTRIKWRASLVPAAAVIPAPLAYIKIVAVKTFEVYSCPTRVLLLYDGSRSLDCCDYKTGCARRPRGRRGRSVALMPFIGCSVSASPAAITLNKLECSKQAILRPRIILHGIMEYDLGLNIHWFVIRSRGND